MSLFCNRQAYNDSIPIQAKHDKELLQVRANKDELLPTTLTFSGGSSLVQMEHQSRASAAETGAQQPTASPSSLLSDVCCQDMDALCLPLPVATVTPAQDTKTTSSDPLSLYVPVPPPPVPVKMRLGILTVSDRASANQYSTGDLSGPAVEQAVKSVIQQTNNSYSSSIQYDIIQRGIVPDDIDVIARTLKEWSTASVSSSCNLILTTGGTGFAPRDMTPEATLRVLTRESRGLMVWASLECSKVQPLAANSRGTAGLCGDTCMIVNLPGSPKGAAQVTSVLLPLLVHAVAHLKP
jgi:molybdopterin adenylyltransferase